MLILKPTMVSKSDFLIIIEFSPQIDIRILNAWSAIGGNPEFLKQELIALDKATGIRVSRDQFFKNNDEFLKIIYLHRKIL